jgi:hypothetical protein
MLGAKPGPGHVLARPRLPEIVSARIAPLTLGTDATPRSW